MRRHIPVGVLFDLLASGLEEPCQLTVSLPEPWMPMLGPAPYVRQVLPVVTMLRQRSPRAQVHFRAFPSNLLLQWEGEQTLRAAYFNSLKVTARMPQSSLRGGARRPGHTGCLR